MIDPSPDSLSRARLDILCPLACLGGCLCDIDQRRYWYARALDVAEKRGHTRAVEEIVTWLRATARSDVALCGDMTAGSGAMLHAAILIERGDHREEPTPPR